MLCLLCVWHLLEAMKRGLEEDEGILVRWKYFSLGSAENRVDSLATIVIVCVLDSAIWEVFFACFFCDGLRGVQKDDAEVFSETCQSCVFPIVGQLFVP